MRLIRVFLALLCAVFMVGHATAQNGSGTPPPKKYSVVFSGALDTSGNVVVSAKFTNLAPPGSGASNISSVSVSTGSGNPLQILGGSDANGNAPIITNGGTTALFYSVGPVLGGQSTTVKVIVSSCGEVAWDSAANTGSQLNGQPFIRDASSILGTSIACGTLACGGNPVQVPAFIAAGVPLTDDTSPQFVEIVRGAYNSNGSCSTGLNYFVTNQLPAKAHVRWPMTDDNGLHAVFAYTLNLPSGGRPFVAWKESGGLPIPFPAPDCTSTRLPSPYGVLNAKLNANKNQFNIDTTGFGSPPTSPGFYIVIDSEWMQVSAISGNQWTVTRTNSAVNPAVTHDKGAYIMSTPLRPITVAEGTADYPAGSLALMCVTNYPTTPVNGTYPFSFIDIGDGWVVPN